MYARTVSVNAETDVFKSKTSKNFGVIAVNNEYTYKILGQDVSVRPLFGL